MLKSAAKFPNFGKGPRKGISLSLFSVKTQTIISLHYRKFQLDETELGAG